jgi:WD repeat-containing protein 48
MTEYQHLIPNWANNFISKGVRPHKDPVKIGFLLKPHSSSPLPNIPNGDTRLLANRVLRVRKLLMHIWEKLEMDREKLRHILYPNEKKSVSESDQNQEEESPLKVEDEIELLCNEQVSTNMI